MSFLFSCSLYFVSFMPLWISVLFIELKSILEHNSYLYTEYASIGCIVILTLASLKIIRREMHIDTCNKTENTEQVQLISAHEEKVITAEFLLSYILPLVAFDFTQWDGVVLFLIFFFTLGYLCVRHNYFCANVILEVAKYRVYQCVVQNGDEKKIEHLIISKQKLNAHIDESLYLKPLNNEYTLDVIRK